jgi:hypothetical protein
MSLLIYSAWLLGGCTHSAARTGVTTQASEATSPVQATATMVRFDDVTKVAGVAFRQYSGGCGQAYFPEQLAAGATLLDADGDGDLDIFFPQPKPLGDCTSKLPANLRNRLYLNDGRGRFALSPKAFDRPTEYSLAGAAGDYDNDGDVDLYVLGYGGNTLFRNKGNGTFEDVTKKAGVAFGGFCTGAVWFDHDGDGDLDLYVARYCEWSLEKDIPCPLKNGKRDYCNPNLYPADSDALFRNNGDGTFSDATRKAGFGGDQGRGLGVAAADFNQDGRIDLFVANDLTPNSLYINQGGGRFANKAMEQGVAFGLAGSALANMGVAVGDLQDDGDLDVLVTTFSNQPYTLYRNDGTDFVDVSATTGIYAATLPFLGFGTGFLDSTNSGQLDLFFANGHISPYVSFRNPQVSWKQHNQFLRNDGNGRFTELKDALPKNNVRVHRGAAFGDIDNDGRVDILVTALDDRPTLLRNVSDAGNWLMLKLTARNGCATPIGARCVATIKGKKKLRVVLGGGSYAGESDHRIHFGLGSATRVDKLEIRWPSGTVQVLENITGNQILKVQEPAAPA